MLNYQYRTQQGIIRQAVCGDRHMQKESRENMQPEVLINCLDVLCRANATVYESDPKLAADIAQAIESLTNALQSQDLSTPAPTYHDEPANTRTDRDEPRQNARPRRHEPLDPMDYLKKDKIPGYSHGSEEIIDVLTNEVIRKPSSK
ncbi:MAG: hypothetical protein HY885_15725 [Deltaproteobacteria bacterium]|nr:hypothetical protein [Deltaproteobacteria bacterium]